MYIGIDVSCWSNRRGFGRFVRELVPALMRLDSDDRYVLFADRQTADEASFPRRCRIVVGHTSVAPTRAAASDGRRSIRDMLAMRRAVHQERIDLMFFPAVYSYFPIANGVPAVVTFHDVIAETMSNLVFTTRRSRLFWNIKCRAAIARANRLLTVSNASARGLIDHFQIDQDRVRVVHEAPSKIFCATNGGLDIDGDALMRHGVKPDDRYLLYVGGISPHKNLDTLVSAFDRIVADPSLNDVRLLLVGDYKNDVFHTCYEMLSRQITEGHLENHVRFLGYVSDNDLRHLYAAAQAFVMPSFLEGFGLPAVEAMACGTAVAASDRGSLPEVLGGAGDLFDPDSVESIAQSLRRLLVDGAHRAELQRRSLNRAAQFSWEQSARHTAEVFHELTTNRPEARESSRASPAAGGDRS